MIYCVELFSGNADITKELNKIEGVTCKSVDYNKDYNPDLCINILDIKNIEELKKLLNFPRIDFIWASPDCTSYSLAAHGIHRAKGGIPKSEYAKVSDKVNNHLWKNLLPENIPFIVENPRAHYRNMPFVKSPKITIYFGQYEGQSPKPTDLFTNIPNPENYFDTKKPRSIGVKQGSTLGLGGINGFLNRCKMPKRFIQDICKLVKTLKKGN